MPRAVALRDRISPETLILGNGDVASLAEARGRVRETGCDGVMLGRAIFGNPWPDRVVEDISPQERLEALLTLARYFDELRPRKSFYLLKKHFKAFVTGWPEAAVLRARLMEVETLEELESVLSSYKP